MPVEREIDNIDRRLTTLEASYHEAINKQSFSNGEIRQILNDLKKDISEILTQTKITNGRVSALEQFKTSIKSTATAISFAVSFVVGLISLAIRFFA
jgi:hypothetical protein